MQVEKLTDLELYASLYNHLLAPEAKDLVKKEFSKRDFSIGYVDQLAMTYEKSLAPQNTLSLSNKLSIVIFPWIIPLQAILANKHLATNNNKKWNDHWLFVTIGIAFWTIVLLLVARFCFNFKS